MTEAWQRLADFEAERDAMQEANYQQYRETGRFYQAHTAKALRAITKRIMQARCAAQGETDEMARTASEILADAKAENYWSAVERRNEKRRADRAAAKSRHICCQCKAAPVMATMNHGGGHCKACDVQIRQEFTPEQYAEYFGEVR